MAKRRKKAVKKRSRAVKKKSLFKIKPKTRQKVERGIFWLQVFAVFVVGFFLFIYQIPEKKPAPAAVKAPAAAKTEKPTPVVKTPEVAREVYLAVPEKPAAPPEPVAAPTPIVKAPAVMPLPPKPKPSGPMIAFVIDDIGNSLEPKALLVALEDKITYAVLPLLSYSTYYSALSQKTGADVLLHLPLETKDGTIPGPGLITDRMSPEYIREMLARDLETVPYHVGVNNHMGSLGTENGKMMQVILEDIRSRGLFFLDSQTTSNSTAYPIANKLGLPALKRDVFLDNVDEPEAIRKQIDQVRSVARAQGFAIAIGHPRENTLRVLAEVIPQLEKENFRVVGISELVENLF